MTHYYYATSLLLTLLALALIDRRYQLVFASNAPRAIKTIVSGVVIFSAWDLLGIHIGIFFSGHSQYALDWFLLPNFPPEELLFLTMLCYLTLVLQRAGERT